MQATIYGCVTHIGAKGQMPNGGSKLEAIVETPQDPSTGKNDSFLLQFLGSAADNCPLKKGDSGMFTLRYSGRQYIGKTDGQPHVVCNFYLAGFEAGQGAAPNWGTACPPPPQPQPQPGYQQFQQQQNAGTGFPPLPQTQSGYQQFQQYAQQLPY